MVRWLLALNVILLLAVGFLFYRQFSGTKVKSSVAGNTSTGSGTVSSPIRIAYFEMDSVEENLEIFKEVQKKVNQMQQDKVNSTRSMQDELRKTYDYFQKEAQAQRLSQESGEQLQRQMQDLDSRINNTRDKKDQEINRYLMENQQRILGMIRDFFRNYNKDKGYTYIFASEPGLMYFKDTAYNVTADLLQGLNKMNRDKKENK